MIAVRGKLSQEVAHAGRRRFDGGQGQSLQLPIEFAAK